MTCCADSYFVTVSVPCTSFFDGADESLFGAPDPKAGATALQTEGAQAFEALPEGRVGEAVDETVTEAVADGQPCGEEGGCGVVVDPSALQQKVEDVGQPEDVKHARNAEQYHRVSLVWVRRCGLLILWLGFLWLGQVG